MSEHLATVRWTSQGDFAANKYSRAHVWEFDGGAIVPGSASPMIVPLPYSSAEAVDPEEAYVASLSSCHMLWFLDLARRAGVCVASYTDAAVGYMSRDAEGKFWISKVELHPQMTWDGPVPTYDILVGLHHAAHAQCFIANSIKTEVVTILDQ
ncbi:MAG: OsmC family protein [Litoreibacter sp.]